MVRLDINNSVSQITGLDREMFGRLRMAVCYFDHAKFRRCGQDWLCRTWLIETDGAFLTGLLPYIKDFFKKNYPNYPIEIHDHRVKVEKYIDYECAIEEPPLYEDQEAALEACMKYHKGVLSIPTGVGKTRTFKELIILKGVRTFVMTPNLNLKTQAYNYLKLCFPEHTSLYKKSKDPTNIVVSNYQSVSGIPKEYLQAFDMIITDEFHHSSAETIRKVEKEKLNSIYYRYAFTATNYRNGGDDILLHSVMSNTIFHLSLVEAVNKKYIVPVKGIFFVLKNDHLEEITSAVYKGKKASASILYSLNYDRFITDNEVRNKKAIELAKVFAKNNTPTLILVSRVQHGLKLLEELGDCARFANSTTQKQTVNFELIDQFNEGKFPVLIGTSVIGEGIDTKRCEVVINLSAGKAKSELLQKVGRAIRRFEGKTVGFYIDFIDEGCNTLRKHSIRRKNIIKSEYGINPTLIDV